MNIVESSALIDCMKMQIGKADALCGMAAYEAIMAAVRSVIDGENDAVVTVSVNKYSVHLADIDFSGHTELIAEMCS